MHFRKLKKSLSFSCKNYFPNHIDKFKKFIDMAIKNRKERDFNEECTWQRYS